MNAATFNATILFIYIIPFFTMTLRDDHGYSPDTEEKIEAPRRLHNMPAVIQTVNVRARILFPSLTQKPKL